MSIRANPSCQCTNLTGMHKVTLASPPIPAAIHGKGREATAYDGPGCASTTNWAVVDDRDGFTLYPENLKPTQLHVNMFIPFEL